MENKLSKAVFEDNVDLVNILINDGADIDGLDELGMTPLLLAVESESIRLIELFIGLGANINKKGHEGFAPLHLAVDISIDGTIQTGGKPGDEPLAIISFLISNGADITSKTDKGDTPIDIAKAYEANKVIEFLNETKP